MPQLIMQATFWVHVQQSVAVLMLEYIVTGLITVIILAYGLAEIALVHWLTVDAAAAAAI